ncbi:MAG: hypothetical protein FJY75_11890, partial [Candidatus Eisenbacteria bacterium]|nr:hypothetical protein [Candidatus Eisenbacteria bacterium]
KITNFSLYNAIAIKGQTGGTLTGNYGVAGEHLGGQTRGYLGGRDEAVRGVHAPSGTYGCLGMASQGAFGRSPTAGTRGYLGGFVGAYGEGPAGDFGYLGGYLGGSDDGARGHHAASANYGSIGRADCGIYGRHAASGNDGTIANHTEGVLGVAAATGNHGKLGCSTAGVHGRQGLLGPHGYLGGTHGAYGEHPDSSTWGALGAADGGVVGRSDYVAPAVLGQNSVFDTRGSLGDIDGGAVGRSALSTGVLGPSSNAVRGEHASGSFGHIVVGPLSPSGPAGITVRGPMGSHVTTGALGHQEAGVLGEKSPRFYGALARLVWDDDQDVWQYGVFGYDDELLRDRSYTWAGGFSGDVYVLGWLSKWGGYFLIDHPLDPANKLLRHSFVESPENLLIYRGRARLDASGEAAIALPEYFAALTREDEATVGLSCVGASFLTGYEWESDYGSFRVFGDPGREVSWAVYADRDDPVIRRLARPVEEEKGRERGYCDRGELLNPTAYGYPESAGWAHKLRRDERSPAAPSPEHIHGE